MLCLAFGANNYFQTQSGTYFKHIVRDKIEVASCSGVTSFDVLVLVGDPSTINK